MVSVSSLDGFKRVCVDPQNLLDSRERVHIPPEGEVWKIILNVSSQEGKMEPKVMKVYGVFPSQKGDV